MIRIIAGTARGLTLRVPRGMQVRPTGARVRTSLFSILADRLEGARVVDLFAGCGALGLEALSRGAAFCCFVETAREALAALEDNLARARLGDRAQVLRQDALTVAAKLAEQPPADLVLIDPPYPFLHERLDRFLALLAELADGPALAPDSLIVLQHDTRTALPSAVGPLRAADRRDYGGTTLTFLKRANV